MKSIILHSKPVKALRGEIHVPGDKSISHRALIFGAIAQGITRVHNLLEAQDCMATLSALRAMGVSIEKKRIDLFEIQGVGKRGLRPVRRIEEDTPYAENMLLIDCANSGTTMRLLAGLLVAQPFSTRLTGDRSLLSRPMDRISVPLLQMGANMMLHDKKGPIVIQGNPTLTGIRYNMPIASAQVKSALLLAGMYAHGETCIIEPLATRDHTERMLTAMSYPVKKTKYSAAIGSDAECLGTELYIPGDLSSAAFFIVAATLIPGSDILLRSVGINPTRIGILDILIAMGANINITNKVLYGEEPVADIRVRAASLEGIDIPAALVPLAIDEFPVIFVAAALARGQTKIVGIAELRVKESDRIAMMTEGLQSLGIEIHALPEGVVIQGGQILGGRVKTARDHRIAMAFAIAGAVSTESVIIDNAESIGVSFPDFIATARKAGFHFEVSHAEK